MLKKISSNQVALAVDSIVDFCKKLNVEIDVQKIAKIAIALREQSDFEWSPASGMFRRITFKKIAMRNNRRTVAVVHNLGPTYGVNEELTIELNNMIFPTDRFEWISE